MNKAYLEASQSNGQAVFSRAIEGEVIMLNLIKLRETADYSQYPELAGEASVSGKQAFQKYIDHALPFLEESGGDICLLAEGGRFLIGPEDESWDLVMLIKQASLSAFLAFSSNQQYLQGLGHRSAAILDSRLLPLAAHSNNCIPGVR